MGQPETCNLEPATLRAERLGRRLGGGPQGEACNLILTGFMGTGKTVVGREVARRLGREFVDMDEVIARRAGKPIPAIFAEEGEAAFRHLEAEHCRELSQRRGLVIATGGGALIPEANRRRMEASGLVICLSCSVEEMLRRLAEANDRPLLEVADRRAEIERLLEQRREAYAAMPARLDTTGLTPNEAADRVIELWRTWLEGRGEAEIVLPVRVPGDSYTIRLGHGLLARLGERLREAGLRGPVAVVSNPTVWQRYGQGVEAALQAAGLASFVCLMPDGEQHKTLDTVAALYQGFVAGGLDRNGTVLAVGGGVVGDVAGFAAATYLRGVPLVQVPTTLLAMVDASVGGKTGVDLPQGKNLVGAFKQPALVVIDPEVLCTLPMAELRCGLAEVVKAAIIGDPELFEHLEKVSTDVGQDEILPYETWDWPWIIRHALAVKISVVEEDPLERGRRAVLNLGHTFGHALERLSGYTLPHGQAVSIGLIAAARLAVALGCGDAALPGRLAALLGRLGLPMGLPDVEPAAVWEAMQSDKKRRGQKLRFVLPRRIGEVFVTDEAARDDVVAVLEALRET
ncbi:MAG: 3-dehydroquinate synthase [Anaerolineae bacterium]|nr:3-dehydroquinate synthase [Anaerolineae bacterium]